MPILCTIIGAWRGIFSSDGKFWLKKMGNIFTPMCYSVLFSHFGINTRIPQHMHTVHNLGVNLYFLWSNFINNKRF